MNVRLALLILVLNVFHNAFGQVECGTVVTEKTRAFLRKMKTEPLKDMLSDEETVKLAISAHIVRRSDGTGGLTTSQLESAIADANVIYQPLGISFFLFHEINYIDDDQYYNFSRSDEHQLTTIHDVENTINSYFFNTINLNGRGVCGYTRFRGAGVEPIILANSCVVNGSALPHELGHYFSLEHTHGNRFGGTTDELVDGSNCATAGDYICDTPADPNLYGKVNGACSYTGTDRDANGDAYDPNTRNLMSYSLGSCLDELSAGQGARMLTAYHQYKSYLISKSYAANFDVPVARVCQGSQVAFNNRSLGAIVGYHWSFPGGSPSTSTSPNPTITYSTSGTYDVTLTVTGEDGNTSIRQRAGYINVIGTLLVEKQGSFEEADVEETIINEDNNVTFERTRASASDGDYSMKMDFSNYSTSGGEEDYLIFSTLNTQIKKAFVLSFDHAYAYYTFKERSRSDSLAIVYRRGCGPTEEWVEIWRESGDGLSTIEEGGVRHPFTPSSAEQWTRNMIVFEVGEALETVEFAFKAINDFGNNLYLDNYAIHPIISNIEVTNADCPNGGKGSLVVETRPETGPFTYQLNDGEWVSSPMFSGLSGGEYTLALREGNGMEFSEKITVGDWIPAPVISKSGAGLSIDMDTEAIAIQWLLNGSPIGGAGSPSYLPLAHGEYTVEISKGRCTVTSGRYMTVLPQIDQVHINNTDCHNTSTGSVEVDASGGIDPIRYQLNDGAFRDSGAFPDLGIGSYTVTIQDAAGAMASETITIEADETLEQPQIINNGNELSVPIENGSTVQWLLNGSPIGGAGSPSYLPLAHGEYTVEISRGRCTVTSGRYMTVLPQIDQVHVNNTDCHNTSTGSVEVDASRGINPIRYQLNDGIYGDSGTFPDLGIGSYTVTIQDAAGAMASETITIEADETLEQPQIINNGNELSVPIENGSTVQWLLNGSPIGGAGSPSYLPLAHGEYIVEISRGRCTVTSGRYMTVLPQIDQVHINNTDCHNTSTGSVEVDASGGINPIRYQLNDGIYGDSGAFPDLGIGSYTVTIQDAAGAMASETITIEADETLEQPQIINNGNELSVPIENGSTVQWLLDGMPIEGVHGSVFTAETSGSYTVRVFSGACTMTSEPEILIILGLNEIEKELEFYPNPTSDELVIKMSKALQRRTTSLRVRDFTGKVVMSGSVQPRLKIDRLRQGVYLLELVGTGFVMSRKFVKTDQ